MYPQEQLPERQNIIFFNRLLFIVLPFRQQFVLFAFPQVVDRAVMKIQTFQVNLLKLPLSAVVYALSTLEILN